MKRAGVTSSGDGRSRSRSSVVKCIIIYRQSLNNNQRQDNHNKRAMPRRSFQVLTQSFLDIIKTNSFKIFIIITLFSQIIRMQKMARPNLKNAVLRKP